MALSRRGPVAIATIAAATTVVLVLLWGFGAPWLIGLPGQHWRDNLIVSGAMALVVLASTGVINVVFRLRWRKRRPAELPVRQLLSVLFGCVVAVLVAWAAALHSVPAPFGAALAGAHLGIGILVSLMVMCLARLLLRSETMRRVSGDEGAGDEAPRLSWSRVGLRGYLLCVVVLLGAGATCLVVSYQHTQEYAEAANQRARISVTLLELMARRAAQVPRTRILGTVGRARLPTGTVLRVVTADGRFFHAGSPARAGKGGGGKAGGGKAGETVRLMPGGRCVADQQHTTSCRWKALDHPHDELALVALSWPATGRHFDRAGWALLLFVVVLILFAAVVAYLMGRDVSLELGEVAARVRSMAEHPEKGLGEPLRPTSSDEMGELLVRFGEVRQMLQGQLAVSARDVHRSAEVDRAKTAFLEEVNFALRTPLTAVIGYAELLQEGAYGEVSEAQAQEVQITLESSEQLLGLVQDIVDVSFAEAGGIELRPQAVELGALVRSELSAARAAMEHSAVTLRAEVPEDLPPVVLDTVRIRRVLANLLSNAIKFTSDGEVVLSVSLPDQGSITIGVRDTGVGIAPEHQSVVFEQYRQAPQARPKELRGSGLGLAIVQQLVRLHDGRVWLESTPGEGSEFFFSLPIHGPEQRGDNRAPTGGNA